MKAHCSHPERSLRSCKCKKRKKPCVLILVFYLCYRGNIITIKPQLFVSLRGAVWWFRLSPLLATSCFTFVTFFFSFLRSCLVYSAEAEPPPHLPSPLPHSLRGMSHIAKKQSRGSEWEGGGDNKRCSLSLRVFWNIWRKSVMHSGCHWIIFSLCLLQDIQPLLHRHDFTWVCHLMCVLFWYIGETSVFKMRHDLFLLI